MESMPGQNSHIWHIYGATHDEVVTPHTCEGWLYHDGAQIRSIEPYNDGFRLCGAPVAALNADIDWSHLDSSEQWLPHRYCNSCLASAINTFRKRVKEREERQVKQYRRERCLQALRLCTDDQIIATVEEHGGDLAAALKALVPPDIPKLRGYFHPLREELQRRGLMPIFHHARLQTHIETRKAELDEAHHELTVLAAEVARIKGESIH